MLTELTVASSSLRICMFDFVCLPSPRRRSRAQNQAALDHHSCVAMVLSLDSLGQCVSALSKRFAAAESIRDSAVNCLPHSHREKHSEVRHRKDAHHQQEETPKPKVPWTAPSGGSLSIVNVATEALFLKVLSLPVVCCQFLKMD